MSDQANIINAASEIIPRMVTVLKNVGIYPPMHPSVIEPAAEICRLLKGLFARRPHVSFHLVDSQLYIEKYLLRAESIKYVDFIDALTEHGINSFALWPEITPKSLAVFLSLISGKDACPNKQSLRNRIENEGITGITLEDLVPIGLAEEVYELVEQNQGSETAQSSYNGALNCMEAVEQDVRENKPLNAHALQAVVSSLMEDFIDDREAMTGVMSIKNYDDYLFHHSVNVAITSLALANRLSLDHRQIRLVGVAALLHDIGKVNISQEILNKPGKLTEKEWLVIRRHPIEGAQILMRNDTLDELTFLGALEHHAAYDLSGYPTLKGKRHPHALARIIGIADVYEAMTAVRCHRPALRLQSAVEVLIQGAGRQFDPLLVKLLLNIIGVFPPGSLVRLATGETAVVVQPNEENPFLPKVRIIDASSSLSEGPIIDTAKTPSTHAVVGVADPEKI
ncbi:MAG: HD domain-containing protein [Candidatus Abyssubacteria bacterium]